MNWAWLLFSFKGRIKRLTWWLTNLVVVVVIGVAGTIIEAVADSQGLVAVDPETNEIEPTGIFGVILAILGLVNLWIIYALGAKRLHDRDRTGWWLAVPLIALIVGILLASMALSLPEGGREPWNTLGVFTVFFVVGTWLWLLLEIGFLPGTEGPNRFGPDPKAGKSTREP